MLQYKATVLYSNFISRLENYFAFIFMFYFFSFFLLNVQCVGFSDI